MDLNTGNQLRAARALAGWSQIDLAQAANVNVNTIRNMEGRGEDMLVSNLGTLHKVKSALEGQGIEFLAGPGAGLGVRIHSAMAPQSAA
jgi:transcriptional regulator with XRE-family HTH domain